VSGSHVAYSIPRSLGPCHAARVAYTYPPLISSRQKLIAVPMTKTTTPGQSTTAWCSSVRAPTSDSPVHPTSLSGVFDLCLQRASEQNDISYILDICSVYDPTPTLSIEATQLTSAPSRKLWAPRILHAGRLTMVSASQSSSHYTPSPTPLLLPVCRLPAVLTPATALVPASAATFTLLSSLESWPSLSFRFRLLLDS